MHRLTARCQEWVFSDYTVFLIKSSVCSVLFSVSQLCPILCNPMAPSVHRDSPGKNTRSGLQCPSLGDLPNPGIEPRSPSLQANSLPSEPPGKARIVFKALGPFHYLIFLSTRSLISCFIEIFSLDSFLPLRLLSSKDRKDDIYIFTVYVLGPIRLLRTRQEYLKSK